MSTLTKQASEAESRQARELAQALARQKAGRGKVQLRIEKKTVDVPEPAVPLIAEIMEKLGAGECVEVRTVHDTLSTTEAAEILNVSRPYVVKLLEVVGLLDLYGDLDDCLNDRRICVVLPSWNDPDRSNISRYAHYTSVGGVRRSY